MKKRRSAGRASKIEWGQGTRPEDGASGRGSSELPDEVKRKKERKNKHQGRDEESKEDENRPKKPKPF